MKHITKINLGKLKFIFLLNSMIFGTFALILVLVAGYSDQFPDVQLLFYIALGALLVLPLFISSVSISAWLLNQKQQTDFFDLILKSHLEPIGFKNEILDIHTKWKFAHEVYGMELFNWKIICFQNKQSPSDIEFNYARKDDAKNVIIGRTFTLGKKEIRNMKAANLKLILEQNIPKK